MNDRVIELLEKQCGQMDRIIELLEETAQATAGAIHISAHSVDPQKAAQAVREELMRMRKAHQA